MTKYLISFPSSAMDVPDEDLEAVSYASHAVVEGDGVRAVWRGNLLAAPKQFR